MRKYLKFYALILLVGVLLIAGCSTQVANSGEKSISTITVDGVGKIITQPDTVEIRISVVTQGEGKDVQEQNAAKAKKVIDALIGLGLNKEEIKTENVNFYPMRRWTEKNGEEITGYRAENTLVVKTSQLEKAGVIADIAVKNGADNVGNLAFSISDKGKESLLDKAIEKAVSDAKKQAEAAAKAAGVDIVGIKNIRVVKNSYNRGPIFMEAKMKSEDAVETPVMPKDAEYLVNVNVDFLIK